MGVFVVVACALLLAAGIAVAIRWGDLAIREITPDVPRTIDTISRLFLRSVLVAIVSGVGAGVFVAGAGGRLAMRLLAATSSDAVQGRTTEADATVGSITVGGSLFLMFFAAIFFGGLSGVLYMALRRWLPTGRLGGLCLGLILLITLAPMIDPIRRDNIDFDLVGPGWLALTVFAALTILQGFTVVAIAGRYSQNVPLIGKSWRNIAWYLPLVVFVPAFPALLGLAIVWLVVVISSNRASIAERLRDRKTVLIGRVLLLLFVIVATPRFVTTVIDIAGRG